MLANPPPARCDGCGRVVGSPHNPGPAAGDEHAWIRLDGTDAEVTLDGGRRTVRHGCGWVCRSCGHTVQLSFEHARGGGLQETR